MSLCFTDIRQIPGSFEAKIAPQTGSGTGMAFAKQGELESRGRTAGNRQTRRVYPHQGAPHPSPAAWINLCAAHAGRVPAASLTGAPDTRPALPLGSPSAEPTLTPRAKIRHT
jgi:hypothetical protein